MDTVTHQLAHEMTEAIGAAAAADPRVEACREKARAAGYDLRVSVEAVIGFVKRAPAVVPGAAVPAKPASKRAGRSAFDITANDRRFLKSLRIAADEATTKEAE